MAAPLLLGCGVWSREVSTARLALTGTMKDALLAVFALSEIALSNVSPSSPLSTRPCVVGIRWGGCCQRRRSDHE